MEQKAILIIGNVSVGVLAILLTLILIGICILIKNENTYKQHTIIDRAILKYQLHCVANGKKFEVGYQDVERYDRTLSRFWDWGYKRLLPKDKLELIEPFIKEEVK